MNGTYDTALTAKQPTSPTVASSAPASAGPRMRDRLNWIELSASPVGICSCSTIDGTIDWYDGIDSASVTPTTSASATTIHGAIHAGRDEHDERERAQHLERLKPGDHAPPVGVIREHAAEEREQPLRRVEHERVEPDDERRRAEVEEQPRLGDLLRPEAEVRDQRREPERAEPAAREQRERSTEAGNLLGHRRRFVQSPFQRAPRRGRSHRADLAVILANEQYLQARLGYTQTIAQRLQDTVALYAALGGGWWR